MLALGRNLKGPLERLIDKTPAPSTSTYHILHSHTQLMKEVEKHVGVAKARQARYYNASIWMGIIMYCVLFFGPNVINGEEGKDRERQRVRQVEPTGVWRTQPAGLFCVVPQGESNRN